MTEEQFPVSESEFVPEHDFEPWGMELKTYTMLMHLSQFAGVVIPFGGLIMPIIMWVTNKDKSEVVDAHGKNIVNWMISAVIYGIIGAILSLIVIGIFALLALGVCAIVFAIIGAVKANEGKVYEYPLTIKFIK